MVCAKSRKCEAGCIQGMTIVTAFVGRRSQRGQPGGRAGAVACQARGNCAVEWNERMGKQ